MDNNEVHVLNYQKVTFCFQVHGCTSNGAIRPVSRLKAAKLSNPPVFSGWLLSFCDPHLF